MAQVIDAADIDFSAYMDLTENEQRVKPAATWRQMFLDHIAGKLQGPVGAQLPWAKAQNKVMFAPGGVSLWIGINGHGKSLVLGQCALSWCTQGEKVCIASLEMKPFKTIERMAHQWLDTRFPNADQGESFMQWSDGKLWLYDQQGTANRKTMIGAIRYSAKELGITQFVVDNLIKCVKSDDDYEGQKAFVDDLTTVARDENIHIHLVHHARKTQDEMSPPRKMDSLGAGSITNLVDNLLIVWRNKRKEDDASKNKEVQEMDPDAFLLCDKNRHGDWEGRISLWFHQRSTQFIAHPRDTAMTMAAWPHDANRSDR